MKKLEDDDQHFAKGKMGIVAVERRRYPRFVVELPLDYSQSEDTEIYGGIVANASEGGYLSIYLKELTSGLC